jgi:hypothetical protein
MTKPAAGAVATGKKTVAVGPAVAVPGGIG